MKYRLITLSIFFILACAAAAGAQEAGGKKICPGALAVSAPFTVKEGEPLTFAVAAGDTPPLASQLNYVWTIRPASARVLGGAGTPAISVDTAKLGGKRVAASLSVEGRSKEYPCRVAATASTAVVAPRATAPPYKFAEFISMGFKRDKEQLERLAAFMRNSPEAVAYLIAYGGRGSRRGQAERLGSTARNYLLMSSVISGIGPEWVVAVNGGQRERDTYELWVVPQGAPPPQPTPTGRESINPAAGDWKFPAPNMKVKKDGAGDTAYLLGKDEQDRPFYATRIKSDGRDAVMVKMPDKLYSDITKDAEGDAPDYVLATIAFGYACHPGGANAAASYIAAAHPEYRFRTRSGRTAHVVTGRDKTVAIIWIEPPQRSGRADVSKPNLKGRKP